MTCANAQDVGAYAIGTLDPADRARLEAHLPACAECREVLESVAGLPRLLALVPPDAVAAAGRSSVRPSEAMYERLLAAAVTRRSRRRVALAAAAAVVAVAAGGTGIVLATRQGPQVEVVAAGAGAVHATVELRPTADGTDLRLMLSGVPPEQHCRLVAVDSDGHREVTSSWEASYTGTATLDSSTTIQASRLAWLRIETDSATLVSMRVPH